MVRPTAATHPSFIVLFFRFESEHFGAKFIGSGSQQSLGLNAGLARGGVQSKKIERDMSDQGKVVGDMGCTGAGIVITELNIEGPVQTIFDFPVAAHRMSDPVGIRREAADVVVALDGRLVADRADVLIRTKLLRSRHCSIL